MESNRIEYVVRRFFGKEYGSDTYDPETPYYVFFEKEESKENGVTFKELYIPIRIFTLEQVETVKKWLINGTQRIVIKKYLPKPLVEDGYVWKHLEFVCVTEVHDFNGIYYEVEYLYKDDYYSKIIRFGSIEFALERADSIANYKDFEEIDAFYSDIKLPKIDYLNSRPARFNEKNELIDIKEFYSSNDYLSHEE